MKTKKEKSEYTFSPKNMCLYRFPRIEYNSILFLFKAMITFLA